MLGWQLQVRLTNPGFSVGKGIVTYSLVKQVAENPIYIGLNKNYPHRRKYPKVGAYLHWFSRSKMSSGHLGASLSSLPPLYGAFLLGLVTL